MRRLSVCSIIILVAAIGWFIRPMHRASSCTFTALDVGQGDALLIRTPDGQDILIDGGPDESVLTPLGRVLPPGDRDIELMVLTHPHADHVDGLLSVTERYTVRSVVDTGVIFHEQSYEQWRRLLTEKKIPEHLAVAGQRYAVGAMATLDVLWPAAALDDLEITKDNATQGGGVNDTSIVLRLTCAGSRAILTGDASEDIESRILEAETDVQAPLLKVGHHGSRYSSSPAWLHAIQPAWAVISVGQNNRYRHPHPTTLLRLRAVEAVILRTDELGDVVLRSNGRGGWGLDKK